ncbi:MAG TPA: ribosome maturation factor RimM [Elainellaceae cyanobacterium]
MNHRSRQRTTPSSTPTSSPIPPSPLPSPDLQEWIEIGKIVAPQGLKGELRVYPNSDFPERFLEPGDRWMLVPGTQELQKVELQSGRVLAGKGLYVVTFAEVCDRDRADSLRDARLFVPAGDRPELEDDEFHVADLIGLSVFQQSTQALIGTVVDVLLAGNDLLEVELISDAAENQRRVLIPFVVAIVPIVDLQRRRIEVLPPDGLLDL